MSRHIFGDPDYINMINKTYSHGKTIPKLKSREKSMNEILDLKYVNRVNNLYKKRKIELTPKEIREHICNLKFVEIEHIRGIYFLVYKNKIKYIGQSKNVLRRLSEHIINKNFDAMYYKEFKYEDLNNIERQFIAWFQPEYNRTGIPAFEKGELINPIEKYLKQLL